MWKNEYYIALECKDLQANAMALDNSGTYVLLAGRRYIAIRNLDEEIEVVQKFPRQSKYDVGAAEWNPTSHNRDLCVISSNQRLEILTWRYQDLIQTHQLRGHSRVITDLNWHQLEPNILASCSVDSFIHLWDLRDSRRPINSYSAIAEPSQIRWNRVSDNVLATSHDGDIKIWDRRKTTTPTQYIAGHLMKIHGLDWNPTIETQLVTSSQDNTVKFFDTANPKHAECILVTNAPVWRARFTPFGNGLITVVVPQLRRGENSLLLWNTANRSTPMHTFVGHRDVVLQFEWRKSRSGSSDFQLITWSKDQTLLVWKIEPFLQKLCGHEPLEDDCCSILHTDDISERRTVSKLYNNNPLQQEFSLLNVHIPNLEVLEMSYENRLIVVEVKCVQFTVTMKINFPKTYPHGVPPVFQLLSNDSTTINNQVMSQQLLQTLNHLAQQRVSKNRTCLESCLRQLVITLEQLVTDAEVEGSVSYTEPINTFGGYNDSYIPFPRTSGAKFSGCDHFVSFSRLTRRIKQSDALFTPRALSALEHQRRSQINLYYYKCMNRKNQRVMVHIFDMSILFVHHRQLASDCILDATMSTICKHNAASATILGRWDLVQIWALAELITNTTNFGSSHPFAEYLTQSLFYHFIRNGDVQTAAMLSCVFTKAYQKQQMLKASLAGNWLCSLSDLTSVEDQLQLRKLTTATSSSTCSDAISLLACNQYKLFYAVLLHRWNLLYHRVELLKHVPQHLVAPYQNTVDFMIDCKKCSSSKLTIVNCIACKQFLLNCIICHVAVKGSANCCLKCGHGGHTLHLKDWFKKHNMCPSGCGCECLTNCK